jgi:hypothetical protein
VRHPLTSHIVIDSRLQLVLHLLSSMEVTPADNIMAGLRSSPIVARFMGLLRFRQHRAPIRPHRRRRIRRHLGGQRYNLPAHQQPQQIAAVNEVSSTWSPVPGINGLRTPAD